MNIGFCGLAGVGKSTAAHRLIFTHQFKRVSFAEPIKALMRALGLSENDMSSQRLKEQANEKLCGKTPRYAMQTLDTAWGRGIIGPDLWLRAWTREASKWPNVVCDDVRFPDEVEAIHDAGGFVVRIERAGSGLHSGSVHASERQILDVNRVIVNNGTIDELWQQIDGLVSDLHLTGW